MSDIEILYEDDWFAVINKPANCLSVPGVGPDKQDSILSRATSLFGEAHTIHRLDYATSGLILVAKTHECQRRMYAAFRDRQVHKEYRAKVRGRLIGEYGDICMPMRCDWPNRPRQMICITHGKEAITHWECIERGNENTSVRLFPMTGRSHQLRVHMQSLGHSIIGDEFYDDQYTEKDERLLLHAYRLEFHHPFTRALVSFVAPCSF